MDDIPLFFPLVMFGFLCCAVGVFLWYEECYRGREQRQLARIRNNIEDSISQKKYICYFSKEQKEEFEFIITEFFYRKALKVSACFLENDVPRCDSISHVSVQIACLINTKPTEAKCKTFVVGFFIEIRNNEKIKNYVFSIADPKNLTEEYISMQCQQILEML